jgi:hypothetical protein
MSESEGNTVRVSDEVFRQVYDSPAALPGQHRWVTCSEDVRKIEDLLAMRPGTIGAPLWVSGDERHCPACGRETSWLDIVASGLARVHRPALIARVILGEQKYVNTEAPRAIANLTCFQCGSPIIGIRSFKCHNWAYADEELLQVLKEVERDAAAG